MTYVDACNQAGWVLVGWAALTAVVTAARWRRL